MAWLNQALLIAGALLFIALLLSAVSQRVGVPALLVFLAVGLVATEVPGTPIHGVETPTAALIGNLALAVILLDGGLRTNIATFRMVAAPALVLATVGVLLTAALVGVIVVIGLGFDWRYGLLVGAVIGSTDAAAVFALLRSGGVRLNERVAATLEVESGLNDPMAVFLTLTLIELIRVPDGPVLRLLAMFAMQLGLGLACGYLLGRALAEVVARVRLSESLYALLIQGGGLMIFALANLLGGSGFLAIYLAGIIVARRRLHVGEDVLRASDGLAWLAQAAMFLILGIFAQLESLWSTAGSALLVALGLVFVARPLAVALCLLPFRYAFREIAFIGWIGLRGAVPIVLALFPLLYGLPQADRLFDMVFFSVLVSLLLQGTTLAHASRLLRVDVPAPSAALSSSALEAVSEPRELVQLRVLPSARVADHAIGDVDWPGGSRIVEVVRDGRVADVELLRAGDVVAVLVPGDGMAELEAMFGPATPGGEWVIDAGTSLRDLQDYYAISLPDDGDAAQSVADFVRQRLRGRPAWGDSVQLGRLTLTVRQATGGKVLRVGLRVDRTSGTSAV
ncbi:MAG: potassium/proton antiporter [Gemmatimonadota bacterium]